MAGVSKTCTSGATEVALSPGDLLAIRIVSGDATPMTNIAWGLRLVP